MKSLLLAVLISVALGGHAQAPHCKGLKKDGDSCHVKQIGPDGYCRFHSPDKVMCAGKKKDGQACRMPVSKKGDFCRYHVNQKQA